MNVETINEATQIAPKKRGRGRPVKDTSIALNIKPLPSVRLAKEDALQHLRAFIELPWEEANVTHKLKAIQLLLQHLDTLEDKTVVAEQKEDVPNTNNVPAPSVETVEIDSLTEEQYEAYQRAFGRKS